MKRSHLRYFSYAELEQRGNQLAHVLRAQGLKRLDHYSVFMENNNRYIESCVAGERSGLYYTCINSYLTAEELAYILNNSESQLLITSKACFGIALQALFDCPRVALCLVVGGGAGLEATCIGKDYVSKPLFSRRSDCAALGQVPVTSRSRRSATRDLNGSTSVAVAAQCPIARSAPPGPLQRAHIEATA